MLVDTPRRGGGLRAKRYFILPQRTGPLRSPTPCQRPLYPIPGSIFFRFPALERFFGRPGEAAATDAAAVVGSTGEHLGIGVRSTGGGVGGLQTDEDDVKELFVEQRLDHFDRLNSRTFSQRYFINKR